MRRWVVILASLALVLALVRAAGFDTVAAVWRSVDPRGIAVSVTCWGASLLLRLLTWRRLLAAPPRFRSMAPPLALGFVLAGVAPAKSGEPASALLLSRATGIPRAVTLSVLTAERGAHLLALLATFVPAAALAAGARLQLAGAVRAAAVVLAVLLAALPFVPAVLRRAGTLAPRLPRGGAAVGRYLAALAALLAAPHRLLPVLGLATAFWGLQYLSLGAILRAGGVSVNAAEAAAVAGAAILGGTLSLLPLGTQDGISALALGALGVPLSRGFALALFHSALSLACSAVTAAALGLAAARSGRGNEEGSPGAP